jgi:uncharacterized membrane protein
LAGPPDLHRVPLIISGAVIAAYAGLSYYSSANPAAKGLGAGLSVGPVLLIAIALLWRWVHPLAAAAVTALLAAALYRYWPQLEAHFEWADLAQQAGMFGLLTVTFARSLCGGRVPVCTQLADKLHGPLLAEEVVYTRRATRAWTVFYAILTLAIVLLFFAAPLKVWSMFVNFGTYGLIALMFAVEHVIRGRALPHAPHPGLLASIRQFLVG